MGPDIPFFQPAGLYFARIFPAAAEDEDMVPLPTWYLEIYESGAGANDWVVLRDGASPMSCLVAVFVWLTVVPGFRYTRVTLLFTVVGVLVRFFNICHPVEEGFVVVTDVVPVLVKAFRQTFVFGWDRIRSLQPTPLLLM